ncbi:hypothetical protein MADRUGA_2 [Mycobacterium phage Madruga]|uniref:Uncharacterized protein n=1 Tax=Mycobacterium phage Madruga TaxID=1675552 RepID=A0A0K1LRW9_9CAUD|nr:hypothetical protein MADRUGA_2 [Mycobacterium phage Madruga]
MSWKKVNGMANMGCEVFDDGTVNVGFGLIRDLSGRFGSLFGTGHNEVFFNLDLSDWREMNAEIERLAAEKEL